MGKRQKSCSVPFYDTFQIAPVFLPGGFHGQRSLAGYSPWSRKEADTAWVTTTFHQMAMAPGQMQAEGLEFWGAVGGAGVSYTRRQDGMKPLRGVRRNKLGQSQRGLQVTENQWKGPESRWWRWHRHRRQAEGSFWRGPWQMSLIRSFGSLGDLVNQESMKSDDEQGCHEEFQHYCHR